MESTEDMPSMEEIMAIRPHVEKKKRVGKSAQYYLARRMWINGRSKRVWQKYMGTAETIEMVYDEYENCTSMKFKSFEYGRTAALMKVAEELDFVEIVNKHTDKKEIDGLNVGEYMLLIIVSRADKPVSKNGIAEWFEGSFLSLIWSFPHQLNTNNFTNHMDYLTKNEHILRKIADDIGRMLVELGMKVTLVFIDTSNFFTYMKDGKKLAKKGKNKQKRNDKNQIGLVLATSDENIPVFHETYPGNDHDAKLFGEIFDKIVERLNTIQVPTDDDEKVVIVLDCGFNSEKNIVKVLIKAHIVGTLRSDQVPGLYLFNWDDVPGNDSEGLLKFLKDNIKPDWVENAEIKKSDDGKNITVTNGKNSLILKLDKKEEGVNLETDGRRYKYRLKKEDGKLNVYYSLYDIHPDNYDLLYTDKDKYGIKGYRIKRKLFGGNEFTVVMRYHPGSYKKQSMTYEKKKVKMLEDLEKIKQSVERVGKGRKKSIKNALIDASKIVRNYEGAFKYDGYEKDGKPVFEYRIDEYGEKELCKKFGKKAIFTDKHEWDSEKIVKTYNRKDFVEKDFKWLKDVILIPVKPIWLQKDKRIRVHTYLCVMGLVFYRYMMWKLKKQNETLSDTRVIEKLEKIRVMLAKRDDEPVTLKYEEMDRDQMRLFTTLGLGDILKDANL